VPIRRLLSNQGRPPPRQRACRTPATPSTSTRTGRYSMAPASVPWTLPRNTPTPPPATAHRRSQNNGKATPVEWTGQHQHHTSPRNSHSTDNNKLNEFVFTVVSDDPNRPHLLHH